MFLVRYSKFMLRTMQKKKWTPKFSSNSSFFHPSKKKKKKENIFSPSVRNSHQTFPFLTVLNFHSHLMFTMKNIIKFWLMTDSISLLQRLRRRRRRKHTEAKWINEIGPKINEKLRKWEKWFCYFSFSFISQILYLSLSRSAIFSTKTEKSRTVDLTQSKVKMCSQKSKKK